MSSACGDSNGQGVSVAGFSQVSPAEWQGYVPWVPRYGQCAGVQLTDVAVCGRRAPCHLSPMGCVGSVPQ